MALDQVNTMNLSDDGEGMVPIHDNPSTSFMKNPPEKNMGESKETMDSTPINDIMMEPPMMGDEPRMQGMMPQMTAPQAQGAYMTSQQAQNVKPTSKNPLNLTDDQLIALVAGVCTSIAISKPVQDRLATSIPRFLNDQGGRSVIGLATTGAVAAVAFYFIKDYVVKP